MFIDEAQINVTAGNGGDGSVSFRREKYVPMGGPDGGDGGDGGNVIILADNHCHGLAQFNREKNFKAENGHNGMGQKKSGKNGEDLILRVPIGTQIYVDGKMIHDFITEGDQIIVAKRGIGGWGNSHFATSIKQAPKWSKTGTKGESIKIHLELKLIADAGLVGLPNSGKSTFLSVVSNARPKIANYPFTTLEPNLGTIKLKDKNIIIADIPGLIEGASKGRGLGVKFLKHIERTKVILHLIDATSEDFMSDYKKIRNELTEFSPQLAQKKEILVITKSDLLLEKDLKKLLASLKRKKLDPIAISSATNKNVSLVIARLSEMI